VALEAGRPWDAPAPSEHGRQWVKIELDHPVNPWEHEGAGSITWSAHLDRLAPLGEQAVSIVKEAWAQRGEDPRERTERDQGDGIVQRSVTVEATTRLGRKAIRIIEALHSGHPFNERQRPERGTWYDP
jgi:hypothetical protein